MSQSTHKPVLLEAVLAYLAPDRGQSYLDLTAGYGGHATAVLERTKAPKRMTLVDRDATAIAALQPLAQRGAMVLHASFEEASRQLQEQGKRFDMILADLGVSSLHLDTSSRGFAFRIDGPLDMRMDQRSELTADTIVNSYDQRALETILRSYGEEPRARAVAAAIVRHRPLSSTLELAQVIAAALPGRSKTHPATKSFQAIRIAVNDELGQLQRSLQVWLDLLTPGGRLGVISFHSLEDRMVKRAFAEVSGETYDAGFRLLTKRPVLADDTELVSNPRARSAKLRVLQRK
ncbi:16S rRNA (cytosine(1402)-N(4))-methyltransferase [Candidatus Saccharibacteria bacterium]|nr:MAG: 16S rRNA (cytosine(1402)-N(4))-methyltransferase [Candidatus Saccharibacteria bacterium]PID99552.1 MAG: 16S rRNA (cytosine(1402)-N(4))-methyltransferase [Candidatus Saccharibacteria bacterium]